MATATVMNRICSLFSYLVSRSVVAPLAFAVVASFKEVPCKGFWLRFLWSGSLLTLVATLVLMCAVVRISCRLALSFSVLDFSFKL
ncbi:hypothetical protein DY000_02012500 [Brassica cretica]|uniref:Uncharacterized protein n=1 Tax=Brassica cretica TaxID=69181 RepID=A0ABQ7CZ14_BRACR|nr:hypothetical protein DY000_02012500 [Brassica cretica]